MNEQHKAFLQMILDNKDKVEQKIKENPNFITELVQHSIKSSSDILYNVFDKDKDNELKDERKYTEGFNNRLYKTWKKPIDYFESLIELISSYTYSFTIFLISSSFFDFFAILLSPLFIPYIYINIKNAQFLMRLSCICTTLYSISIN